MINRKLKTYVKENFTSIRQAAKFFGKAPATVHFWLKGRTRPHYPTIVAVEKKTKGFVTFESWFKK